MPTGKRIWDQRIWDRVFDFKFCRRLCERSGTDFSLIREGESTIKINVRIFFHGTNKKRKGYLNLFG
ncbi:hypothetical protein CH333_05000 [candidate division WOR-3 bacterium JGI_Cruoil_03_44_89]|uniref:Uncharacterized protein n=1 Tax=candidate division WOR-3 bacterium JGI_Cruoil_03_44_89 TaxID=1973748 RepID=A0A235BU61_UNCW3|nr:MAG: hypothetical protein CH333_05000 [candidate division WOR-3 bacterium JGI_Cruoil_03_44_89]